VATRTGAIVFRWNAVRHFELWTMNEDWVFRGVYDKNLDFRAVVDFRRLN
jgi:hypothetical protein